MSARIDAQRDVIPTAHAVPASRQWKLWGTSQGPQTAAAAARQLARVAAVHVAQVRQPPRLHGLHAVRGAKDGQREGCVGQTVAATAHDATSTPSRASRGGSPGPRRPAAAACADVQRVLFKNQRRGSAYSIQSDTLVTSVFVSIVNPHGRDRYEGVTSWSHQSACPYAFCRNHATCTHANWARLARATQCVLYEVASKKAHAMRGAPGTCNVYMFSRLPRSAFSQQFTGQTGERTSCGAHGSRIEATSFGSCWWKNHRDQRKLSESVCSKPCCVAFCPAATCRNAW